MFKIIKERFSKNKRLAKKQPEILRYEELEQRVLFSADAVPGLDTAAVEEQVIVQDVGSDAQAEREAAPETVEQTPEEARSELVLVNENVTDYEQLVADLQTGSDNRIIEVVVLESDRNGIEQVSEILAERSDLAAVHVISHGSDGQISLGDSWLTSTTLQQNIDAVAGWGNALTERGDILFYGCNIAADSDGQSLLDDIAELTEADVIASDDLTGSAARGGDWDLEYNTGKIETGIAVSAAAQANYDAVLATFTVNNTSDFGAGSLRQAILDANASGTPNTINFSISAPLVGGAHTIQLTSALPFIDRSVIIDGTTDPDYAGTPLIVIDGSLIGGGNDNGFMSDASNVTIKGFVIQNFSGAGIHFTGAGDHTIESNYIGTDITGTVAQGNGIGIYLGGGADDVTIGGAGVGNLISGNLNEGIQLVDVGSVTIKGNLIGTDATGTADLGNGTKGIDIQNSVGNLIGGSTTADRNVIAGNNDDGIILWGAGSTLNVIQGNYVGVDATGNTALGNLGDGIAVAGGANNNTIGGDRTAGEGNVLSGNSGTNSDGIEIDNAGADNNKIYGNYIGTNFDGTSEIPNARHGVVIYDGVQGTLIGGSGTGQGNIISKNTEYGIVIDGNNVAATSGNVIQANTIGLNAAGNTLLGNGEGGIYIFGGAQNNTIGGSGAGEGNVISGNGGTTAGVYISGSTTSFNTIQGNLIGTDGTGSSDLGNAGRGVYLNGAASTTVDDNIISGNDSYGIHIIGATASGTSITGNNIGLNAAGTASVLNTDDAIYLSTAGTTTIGGSAVGDGNVINATFGKTGIDIWNTANTTIQGNLLGTDAAGTTRLSGGSFGINAFSAANTQIGGTAAGAGNVIAGYSVTGINFSMAASSGSAIQGNFIGTDTGGTIDLTTGIYGITLQNSATGILIGGSLTTSGNTIAYNSTNGVRLMSTAGDSNSILRNLIYGNGQIGIDLGGDDVTLNDLDGTDDDTGANNLQNFPVITQADLNGTDLTVSGSLDTDGLNTQYRIEFYGNAVGTQDPTHGEGRFYLGSTTVTTNGSGDASFSGIILTGVTLNVGDYVTATATIIDAPAQVGIDDALAYGSTSEFAQNVSIVAANDAPVITSNGGGATASVNVAENTTAVTTVTAIDADLDTLTYSISGGTDSSLFEINASTGELTFKVAPDFENPGDANLDNTFEVIVQADDGNTGTDTQTLYVNVTNVNEGPDQNVQIDENTILVASMGAGDQDEPPYGIVGGADAALFQVSHNPVSRTFYLMFNASPNYESPADSNLDNVYEVTVNFNDVIYNYYVTVKDANDAPAGLPVITGTATEDQTLTADASSIGDEDGLGSFSYQWLRDGSAISGATGTTYTLGDADVGAQISVEVSYTDGFGASETVTSVQTAAVANINDAPVLSGAGMYMTALSEDPVTNDGDLVSAIVARAGGDPITDADAGAVEGIAIFSLSNDNGTWQYDTGSGWQNVGSVSVSESLLLRDTDSLRFVPDADWNGTEMFAFAAWDQTSGTAGTKMNTSVFGGTSAFSVGTAIPSITVTAANDAPTINDGATVTLTGTDEDTTSGATTVDSILTAASWADADSGALKGIAVTGMNSNGTWQYSTDGATWTAFGAVSSSNALLLISTSQVRYVPDGDNGETATFGFVAWDQTTGTASVNGTPGYANPGSGGGTTAYSSQTATASITVTAVNDSPTFDVGEGSLISSFGAGTAGQINDTVIQADGKIIAVGYAEDGNRDTMIARYNADGSLDTTFGGGTGVVITPVIADNTDSAHNVCVLEDGSILITGKAYNGVSFKYFVSKYSADGTLDNTFGEGDGIAFWDLGSDRDPAMQVQADGKILITGDYSNNFILARFNSDGTVDTDFGSSGYVTTDFAGSTDQAKDLAIQDDGKIVLVGRAYSGTSTDVALARYNADGTLDTSFGSSGLVLTDVGTNSADCGTSIELQSDGKLVVSGWGNAGINYDFYVLRYNPDGSLDTTFNGTGKVNTGIGSSGSQSDFANDLAIQSDGKILVTGYSSNAGDNFTAVRYNTDGSLDGSFGSGGLVDFNFGSTSMDRAYAVSVKDDGSLVIGGASNVSGTLEAALLVLKSDGSLNEEFALTSSLGGTVGYTEDSTPVVLDADVQILDPELSLLDNFADATLTLVRNGGANAEDLFSATGTLSALNEGGSLVVGAANIGTVTTNSGGTLSLTFNSNATNALVNSAMQQIAYSNSSDTPPASVQIDWTFSDGNSGSQGSGGALEANGFCTITITPSNDAPVAVDDSITVAEDTPYTSVIDLDANDMDVDGDVLSVVAGTFATAQGGTIVIASDGSYTYTPALNFNGVDTVDYTVTDGVLSDTGALTITVTPVNDAPTATANTVSLASINEDTANPAGATVTSLFGSVFSDATDEVSGGSSANNLAGIAIVANTENTATQGRWQWYDGGSWTDIGTSVSTSSALVLSSDTVVRFLPNADYSGTPGTLTARIIDDSSGAVTSGSTVNVTTSGGTTCYSDASNAVTLNTTIAPVNDAPTATIIASGFGVDEDDGYRLFGGISVADVDAGNNELEVTLSVNDGLINLTTTTGLTFTSGANNTANMTFTGTLTDLNAALSTFTYRPDADFAGTDTITLFVDDQGHSGGTALTASDTANIIISPVNDAPVLLTGSINNLTVNEDSGLTSLGLGSVTYGPGGGSDESSQTLTYEVSVIPDPVNFGKIYLVDGTTQVMTGSYTLAEIQGMQFAPNPNETGISFFSFNVQDDGGTVNGGSDTLGQTIQITVNPVNDAPVVSVNTGLTVDEGATGTVITNAILNEGDPDDDGAELTYTVTGVTSNGTLRLSGTALEVNDTFTQADIDAGLVTYDHDDSETTSDSFSFSLADGGEDGSTPANGTFSINVTPVNDNAPVLETIGNQTVNELATLTFTATAKDADLPADTLTFSLDAASLAAGMTIDANTGEFSWTPTEAQGGLTPSVTITVTDNGTGNLVDSETFTITVNDINTAPVLGVIGNQMVDELATLTFTATATDSDLPADTLTYSLDAASIALGMNIDANTGVFSWTPTEAQGGTAPAVTITVTDSGTGNLVDSETFTITVNDINVAPVLGAIGNQTVDELATLTFTATATDADLPADTLTFSLDAASIALGMSIDANTGVFSWTPIEGQGGTAPSVTITVTDDGTGNLIDSETFTITVNGTNTAPVLNAIGNQTVDELAILTFTATATDSDLPADTLTYSLDAASIALGMSIDANTGVFSWTPTEGQGGLTPSVTVTVTDSGVGNLVDSETFTITVNDVNVAPVLGAIGNQTVNELATLTFTATATDSDLPADTLTYSLDAASIALGMSIDANTGVFSWTPTEGQGGLTPSVTVTVTDSGTGNLTDSETFTITVNDVNVPPVLGAIGNQTVDELATLTFTATATDSDLPADTLTFSLDAASIALGMSIDVNTGVFSWTPTEGQGGITPSVTVTVTDNGTGNLVDSETFTITVNDINTAPVLGAIGNQTVDELATLTFTATATDSDLPADTLTFSLDAASIALGMSIDVNTGVFSWTPTEGQGGLTPSVTVTVTDNGTGNLVDSETFTITVNDINTAPVLGTIGNQTVDELATLSFTATATDSDLPADTLTYSLDAASIALGMSIDANTGVFSWTPTEGQGGLTPSVTVTVTDNGTGNLVDSETFTITVNDTNTAPLLGTIGNQTVDELATLTFTATATDSDLPADTLTFSLDAASIALGMTIDANTGVFSWTPTEGQGGSAPSVTITVTDNGTGNLIDSETFTITVNDVNVAPVLGAIGNQSINELATLSFTATATDSDLPADTLTFSLDAASLTAGMTIDANTGVFSWTPTEGQGGLTPSVTVTVTDSGTGNLVDSETFTITVNDINIAPVLGSIGNQTVDELATLTFTATATDVDLPTDTLTFSLDAASIALGMSIDANTGVFGWTPTEGQGGSAPSVTITVTDNGTGNLVDSETFTITVNDVNVAPVLGAIGDQSIDELATLSFTATATDSDLPADTLTFSLDAASLTAGMTIDANTGVF